MGQSSVLDSISNGNWTMENPLTGINMDDGRFKLYNNVIEKYTAELGKFDHVTGNRIDLNEWEKQPSLDLPYISRNYDILNQKKFSKKVQRWKGVVLQTYENYFEAKLYDLTSPSGFYELGELENDDVSPDDKQLLKMGAIFYWTVGHFMDSGQVTKKSELRFQRLITLNNSDLEEIFHIVDSKFGKLKERKIDL